MFKRARVYDRILPAPESRPTCDLPDYPSFRQLWQRVDTRGRQEGTASWGGVSLPPVDISVSQVTRIDVYAPCHGSCERPWSAPGIVRYVIECTCTHAAR